MTGKNTISLGQLSALQLQQFLSRKINWMLILLFVGAGFYALYQGYADKKTKLNTIQAFRYQNDSLLHIMKTGVRGDTTTPGGKEAYEKSSRLNSGLWNTRLPAFKMPVSTAIYNIGQGDVFPYYYQFNSENFEMQWLKQTEVVNPLRSLAGHFDVTFWIIYLMPLIVLLLTFKSLSEERDNGNWRLIAAQGINENAWLKSSFFIVALFALLSLLLIAIAGSVINKCVFDQDIAVSDVLFFTVSTAYLFFWLSVFYFMNSLRRGVAYNALVSGVCWIGLSLVVPVIISKLAASAVRIDNTTISFFSRRPQDLRIGTDTAFTAGKITALANMENAFKDADADPSSPYFLLRAYYAWHRLLHEERWPAVQQYFKQIEKRQHITNLNVLINPVASTDGYLAALANNDAAAFHDFTERSEQLQDSLQKTMFGSLFTAKQLSDREYGQLPVFEFCRNKLSTLITFYFLFMILLFSILTMSANCNLLKPQ